MGGGGERENALKRKYTSFLNIYNLKK